MPVVRQYEQQVSPTAGGRVRGFADPRLAGAAGEGLQRLGRAMEGAADEFRAWNERRELSTMQADLATARADAAAELQRARETGEAADPDFVERFNELVESRVSEIQNRAKTAVGAESARVYGAQFTSQFRIQAIQNQAQAAGEEARQNYINALNQNRNTLLNSPLQFEGALSETLAILQDPNGPYARMDANARNALIADAKQNLALSAVEGTIHNVDPEVAKQQLQAGVWAPFLDADKSNQLLAMADSAIRAKEVEAMRLEQQRERQEAIQREATKSEFIGRIFSPNGNTLSVKDVLRSNLLSNEKEHFIEMMRRDGAGEGKDDPGTINELFRRIHLPDGDPNKITNENELYPYFGRGLGFTGLNHLRKEVGELHDPSNRSLKDMRTSFLTAMKPNITKSSMFAADPAGEEQYYKYQLYVDLMMQQARERGEDPFTLLDPRSKQYLGDPEVLKHFQRTPQEILQEMADKMRRSSAVKPPVQLSGRTPEQLDAELKRLDERVKAVGFEEPFVKTERAQLLAEKKALESPAPVSTAPTRGNVPARMEGETPQQYLERIKAAQ